MSLSTRSASRAATAGRRNRGGSTLNARSTCGSASANRAASTRFPGDADWFSISQTANSVALASGAGRAISRLGPLCVAALAHLLAHVEGGRHRRAPRPRRCRPSARTIAPPSPSRTRAASRAQRRRGDGSDQQADRRQLPGARRHCEARRRAGVRAGAGAGTRHAARAGRRERRGGAQRRNAPNSVLPARASATRVASPAARTTTQVATASPDPRAASSSSALPRSPSAAAARRPRRRRRRTRRLPLSSDRTELPAAAGPSDRRAAPIRVDEQEHRRRGQRAVHEIVEARCHGAGGPEPNRHQQRAGRPDDEMRDQSAQTRAASAPTAPSASVASAEQRQPGPGDLRRLAAGLAEHQRIDPHDRVDADLGHDREQRRHRRRRRAVGLRQPEVSGSIAALRQKTTSSSSDALRSSTASSPATCRTRSAGRPGSACRSARTAATPRSGTAQSRRG